MSREPVKQKGLATVSCIDGRWFQAKADNPAMPASRLPLSVPEWEVRNAWALVVVTISSLDGAPWLARVLRLASYRRAQQAYQAAADKFAEISSKSKGHEKAAERLQARFRKQSEGKVQA